MTRQTSIDVFNRIKSEGLLSKLRFYVYELLYNHGPLTASELIKIAFEENGVAAMDSYHPRLGELRDQGVVYERGTKICSITGNEVILWDVTSNLPKKLNKQTKIETIEVCSMCGRSWPKAPMSHLNVEEQYCFGDFDRYKKVKR